MCKISTKKVIISYRNFEHPGRIIQAIIWQMFMLNQCYTVFQKYFSFSKVNSSCFPLLKIFSLQIFYGPSDPLSQGKNKSIFLCKKIHGCDHEKGVSPIHTLQKSIQLILPCRSWRKSELLEILSCQ